jgi:hypothetical protein
MKERAERRNQKHNLKQAPKSQPASFDKTPHLDADDLGGPFHSALIVWANAVGK